MLAVNPHKAANAEKEAAHLRSPAPPRWYTATVVVGPALAALTTLLIHEWMPSRQVTLPVHAYSLLLRGLLVFTLVRTIVDWCLPALRRWTRYYGPLFSGGILVLTVWDLITLKLAWMPLPYFPGPAMVFQGLIDDRLILLESAYFSLRLLLAGYFGGIALGVACGILMGWFGLARYWGVPILKLIGPIPATAFVPLAMVLFPTSFFSGAALIALAVWFPVTMLTMSGIANVPVSYFDVARTLGAGRGYLIFRVAVPAALPSIFIGLFMGLGASFLTLMVAETVGVKNGLGWYLKWQQGYAEYDKVYACLIIMAAFFSGLMTLLFKARDRVLAWQKGVIRW
jgi:NitT/TauT family transport system permease protein